MSGRLLVTDQHVPQAGMLRKRMIKGHDRATGIAEEDLDALLQQRAAEDLRTSQGFSH
jgi:hypothetical protein